MADLKLTLACWDYDRTRPLIDGRVKPDGIDLDIEISRPRLTFQRMLDKQEFHVSELSLASYAALKGRGACPFVAVPVVLSGPPPPTTQSPVPVSVIVFEPAVPRTSACD